MYGKKEDQDRFVGVSKKKGQGFKQQLSSGKIIRLPVRAITHIAYVPYVFSAQKKSNVERHIS